MNNMEKNIHTDTYAGRPEEEDQITLKEVMEGLNKEIEEKNKALEPFKSDLREKVKELSEYKEINFSKAGGMSPEEYSHLNTLKMNVLTLKETIHWINDEISELEKMMGDVEYAKAEQDSELLNIEGREN